jgi:hypothetical protein
METSEKILCFIVAGKWILSSSYIDTSVEENGFVDEYNFEAVLEHCCSKLAMVSHK